MMSHPAFRPVAARAPGFDEPLEMLAACHGRIEAQLATLERVIEHVAARGCDAAAQSAAQGVLRYFDTSGRLHHRDEDEDLFPLLRARAGGLGRAEIAAAIDELEREHATMDAQWGRLRARLVLIAEGHGTRLDAEEVARFAWLYRRHMDRESAAVLPFATEVLTARERVALGEKMAARRKIPFSSNRTP
jgi:hemerythrin-like domain-containing protein